MLRNSEGSLILETEEERKKLVESALGRQGLFPPYSPQQVAEFERTYLIIHYVIYDKPADYPDDFVVRRWMIGLLDEVLVQDPQVWLARNLEEARLWVPQNMFMVPRNETDDAPIVESWI